MFEKILMQIDVAQLYLAGRWSWTAYTGHKITVIKAHRRYHTFVDDHLVTTASTARRAVEQSYSGTVARFTLNLRARGVGA